MAPAPSKRDAESQLAEAYARGDRLERELEAMRGRDALTGLLDLHMFRRLLAAEVARARRYRRPLTLGMVDIDGFRAANGRYGLDTGDRVLKVTAELLSTHTREHDFVCRASGDEFAVLMPETDVSGAMQCMDRLLGKLEQAKAGPVAGISVSIGIAGHGIDWTPDRLLSAAYGGVDRARSAGGHRIAVTDAGAEADDLSQLSDAQRDVVRGLAITLLERDRYSGEHSASVVEMASRVAQELAPTELENVRTAALLHDIGKVAIPDDVLHKPGPLTEEEWVLMREHPVIGERILRAIGGLGAVARIVRHEHERWDGEGYPDGLKGELIPVGSRIILACDAFHAMTSDRPYRDALPIGEAMKRLADGSGSQFDPTVVQVLIGHLHWLRQTGELSSA